MPREEPATRARESVKVSTAKAVKTIASVGKTQVALRDSLLFCDNQQLIG